MATSAPQSLLRKYLWWFRFLFGEPDGVTANLSINYQHPVLSGNFYIVHVNLDREKSTDRKAYVTGEIRDLSGKVCVEGTGLFVVPKGFPLTQLPEHF